MSSSAIAPKRPHASGRRARVRRPWWRGPWLLAGTTAVIVAIVAVLLAVGLGSGAKPASSSSGATGGGAPNELAPAAVVDAATHPDPAALAMVGTSTAMSPVVGLPLGNTALTSGGKPLIAYVGSDYCPFCAGRRWSVVVALSRFGTFTNLGATTSSSSDIYPDTASFSFHGASYSSPYLSFVGVEQQTRDRQPLDTPSADVAQALSQFDAPPYSSSPGAIPFLDIGGRFLSIGGGYNPAVLKGMTMEQIAAAMRNPRSPAGYSIMADANAITAAVCGVTGNQPASVCNVAPIPAIVATTQGR